MNNLAEQFDQILNDPERFQQILETARAIGLQPGEEMPTPSPETAGQIADIMKQAQKKEQKQQALINALLPFLRPGKQQRLERAMQVAQLSSLAGFALRGQWKEDGHV